MELGENISNIRPEKMLVASCHFNGHLRRTMFQIGAAVSVSLRNSPSSTIQETQFNGDFSGLPNFSVGNDLPI